MSTLAITAAHFATLPARYAVGRWFNIPISTIVAYNGANVGLNILVRGISYLIFEDDLKIPCYARSVVPIASRVLICVMAVYVTSKLTNPMPLDYAALTDFAASASIIASIAISEWFK